MAPSTARSDVGRRDLHLLHRWGSVPLGAINRQEIRAWAAQLQQRVSPGTVRLIVSLLSASLSGAVDAGLLTANPAAGLKLRAAAPAQERYLTREEYSGIREQLATTYDQLVADFLVHTGLRFGEAAGLHRHRVDLNRGMLRVVETFDDTGSTMRPYPKGRRVRDVPLPADLVDALADIGAGTAGDVCGVRHDQGQCRSGLVFTTATGKPVRNSNWAPEWRRAVEASGVGHVRIHDLRHTYASWLLQGGVSLAEVGQLLGHMSPVTTQRYAWLTREPSAAVLKALGAGPAHDRPKLRLVQSSSTGSKRDELAR